MSDRGSNTRRTWAAKFRDAFRGVRFGMRGEPSFLVHGVAAIAVLAVAAVLDVPRIEWCVLTLCITGVVVAEMFNSALESLAKAVDREHNAHLGAALDIASGAVLLAALGAATVGLLVFVPHFWSRFLG